MCIHCNVLQNTKCNEKHKENTSKTQKKTREQFSIFHCTKISKRYMQQCNTQCNKKKVKNQKAFYKGFSSKQDLTICGFVPVRLTVVFSFLFFFLFIILYIILYYYIELFSPFIFNGGYFLILIVPLFKGGYGG